jgi:DNA-directed RNA polymerase specialized sigma24 family protein
MYEYIDTSYREYYADANQWERNMFQLARPPQPMEKWQDYVDLVKHDGDENAFLVFLHYYEPTINGKVEAFVGRYALQSHFADVKMAYVEALWERLHTYPANCKIPFLKYAKRATTNAMNSYAALNLKGFTTTNDKQYYKLRTAAYIYKTECPENVELAIPLICEKLHMTEKTAKRLLEEVQVLDTFLWYEEKWEDEDYEGPPAGWDATGLLKPYLPEPALLRKQTRKYMREAFRKLSYRERDIVSQHLGFCMECFQLLATVSFEDLADIHQYSTADGVRKAYKRALEKMRKQLEEWGVLESVGVKRVKKTKKLWQFEYRPMDSGEPGLVEFTVREEKPVAYQILRPAEGDTEDLRFGREAAHLIGRLAQKDALSKKQVLILPDSDLMPWSYR